jgi:hypothetical protein
LGAIWSLSKLTPYYQSLVKRAGRFVTVPSLAQWFCSTNKSPTYLGSSLAGKTAVVIGGASGVGGRAYAVHLLRKTWHVVADIEESRAQAVCLALRQQGAVAMARKLAVSKMVYTVHYEVSRRICASNCDR